MTQREKQTEKTLDQLRAEEGLDCPKNTTLEEVLRKILNGGVCITMRETNMEGNYD